MHTPDLRDALLGRFSPERVPTEDELRVRLADRTPFEDGRRGGPWRAAPDQHAPVPVASAHHYKVRRRAAVVRTRRAVRPDLDGWASWLAGVVDDWSHDGVLLGSVNDHRTLLVVPAVRHSNRTWLAVRPLGLYDGYLDIPIRNGERLGWRHLPASGLGSWYPGGPSQAPDPGQLLLAVYTHRQRVVLSNVLVHELQAFGCTGPSSTVVERLPLAAEELSRRTYARINAKAEASAAAVALRNIVAPGGRRLPIQAYCRACGQPLSDPDSVKQGYGPDCWERMTGEVRRVLARPVGALSTATDWNSAIALTMRLLTSGRLTA